jgi:hypothetical protein
MNESGVTLLKTLTLEEVKEEKVDVKGEFNTKGRTFI